jgi:hypothetical protein
MPPQQEKKKNCALSHFVYASSGHVLSCHAVLTAAKSQPPELVNSTKTDRIAEATASWPGTAKDVTFLAAFFDSIDCPELQALSRQWQSWFA